MADPGDHPAAEHVQHPVVDGVLHPAAWEDGPDPDHAYLVDAYLADACLDHRASRDRAYLDHGHVPDASSGQGRVLEAYLVAGRVVAQVAYRRDARPAWAVVRGAIGPAHDKNPGRDSGGPNNRRG
ncbi:hypothetical protein NAC44_14540 [Allorhizobium sp. BGMRC 0089]|uniref:hypothetical protein n=1 Tax=Allorhizobium sonneratiae TaxID=2934936 RepID=UPI002033D07E|nr:hypothetical protein [Allorhizobium sonneratiae]